MSQADVLVRGSTIAQVGGSMPGNLPRFDVSDCFVTPAFVVGHTHLRRALACGMPLPSPPPRTPIDLRQSIGWKLDESLDDDLVHTSALVAIAMAAKAGAACVIDLHSSPRAIDGSLDRIEAALDEVGLRGVLAYETSDRDGRARRDLALRENRRFLKKVRSGKTKHRALVGAHALLSLSDDTLDELSSLADEFAIGVHLHIAEDGADALDAEVDNQTDLGRRLEHLRVARASSVIAQANELTPEIVQKLARKGTFIVTNPRSTLSCGAALFSGRGDHVSFGTDGLDGDILAEARTFALRHDGARDGLAREAGARIVAGQVLAGRLFADPIPPRIVAGARADLTVLDYRSATPVTVSNMIDHVTRGWSSAHVRHTIVGGNFVVVDRTLANVDEGALFARSRPRASQLWERMQGY